MKKYNSGNIGKAGRAPRGFLTDEEELRKPKITVALLKRIGSYILPYRKQILVVLIAIFIGAVLSVVPSILTGRIIDEGIIGKDLDVLVTLVALSFFVTVLANLIAVFEKYMNTWIGQHVAYDMRNKMYLHMQSMSHRFFTTNKQGDIITRMTSDISGVQDTITNTFTSIISNFVILIVALIAMYRMNWILATVGIIIIPFFTTQAKRTGKSRWLLTKQSQECNDNINNILNETLSVSGQMLVKLFNNEQREYEKYEKHNLAMTKINIKEGLAGRWFRMVKDTFMSVGPMLIYLVGGILIIKFDSTLSVGDITVMIVLLSRMYNPVNRLLDIQVDVIRSLAMFTRIFEYFDMPVEIEEAPDAIAPTSMEGNLSFKNVHFYYNEERPILNGVNFDLESGKCIAIVGPSGAGKSTIINLIPRLYDVIEGEISIDGNDIRKLDLNFLRKNIGIVTQETYLFNGTIRENLQYAKFDATDEEIIDACKKANLHDFIMSQSEGYDTVVGNRGLKLSGGEKQRMSIARVFLKNPSIMIFDEATSALDSISEQLVQDAIEPLILGRTSIVIAHRLSTIMAADKILVINDGDVVEQGKHSELVQQNGVYTKLYETQFQKALEEHEQRKKN